MSGEVIMTVKDVCKDFQNKDHVISANDHINFTLQQGEILGIVGESGSGKSTIAKLLMQIQSPDHGEIRICGKEYSKLSGEALRQQRRNIQMIFQDPIGSMNPKKKVKQIVCEPLLNYGLLKRKEIRDKAIELLKSVNLGEEFVEKYPHTLSGGQAQRVAIARAIALEPKILLCDEATSALDVSVQKKIVETLMKLNEEVGISIIFISHDIYLTKFVADRILVMNQGIVVEKIEKENFDRESADPYTRNLMNSARILNESYMIS
ncbi:MAG: dipeptide/oligopeptide/nickel ABC transporter ATP-binding protein [Eubacteriales bacterium]